MVGYGKSVSLLMLIIFCFSSITVYAQEDIDSLEALFDDNGGATEEVTSVSEQGTSESSDNREKLVFKGEHTFLFPLPFKTDSRDFSTILRQPFLRSELNFSFEKENFKLKAGGNLNQIIDQEADVSKAFKFDLQETTVFWNEKLFKLGFGFQEFAWGSADGLNPTDNLNPNNYFYETEIFKIPVLSVSASFFPKDFLEMELVYVPKSAADIVPYDIATEIPAEIFNEIYQPREKKINYREPENLKDSQKIGTKISYYSAEFDVSLSYVYDIDSLYTPDIIIKSYMITTNTFYRVDTINLYRDRIHRLGFDMKTTVKGLGLWLESAYSITKDIYNNKKHLRNNNLEWTLGGDFNYGPDDRFYCNLQYNGKWVPLMDTNFYSDYPGGEPDLMGLFSFDYMEEFYYRAFTENLGGNFDKLQHGFVLKMDFPLLNSILIPSLTATYFIPSHYDRSQKIKGGSLFVNPEIGYKPNSSLTLSLGINYFDAWKKEIGSDTWVGDIAEMQLGRLRNESSIYFKAGYSWGINKSY